jgi:hypothetical protein
MTWLRKRNAEFYSGSDPEWQEFMALSNIAKQKAVKAQLSDMVCKSISKDPTLTLVTGKPLKVFGYWLDFHFPQRAPPEYERSGILWVDNRIIWTTRRFDDREARRLSRVLVPTALSTSLQTLSWKLLTSHYESFKKTWSGLGRSQSQPSADKPVEEPLSPAMRQAEAKGTQALSVEKPSRTTQQSPSSAATPKIQTEVIHTIMPEPEPNSAISAATKEFKSKFLKSWRSSQSYHPRGACFLKGEIGVIGPKGRCKMSVTAVYLPKEDVFVQIVGTSTGIWPNKQTPLGKPKPEIRSKPESRPET